MHLYTSPSPPTSIPVIDLSDAQSGSGQADAARQIHRACRETGFFYVSGHGIARQLVDAQFAAAQRFFALPLEEKLALHMHNSPTTAGYEPMGGQILDSQDATSEKAPPDLKESFYCGLEVPVDHPMAVRKARGFGHNQWPQCMPDFRTQMLAYYDAVRDLGDRILSLLALSLELDANWFAPFYADCGATLRLIHYPPQPARTQFNQIGAGAHTDWGGITILAQDDIGGLEVQTVTGDWIEATPIPETFVINLGDLMARWTNGIYNSNLHRVKNARAGADRYSVPFFYSPSPDSLIEPMPSCIGTDHPRRFADCTAAEHMSEMFRRSYGYALTR
jgi:isopenicillin N synthase-like dioxygenase